MITIFFVVIVIAVVASFSIQNAAPVSISFLFWHFEASLAIIVMLSLLMGMIVGMIVLSWTRMRLAAKKKKEASAERSRGERSS